MTRQQIANRILDLAHDIKTSIPKSREAALAMTKLEEAMHWIAADAVVTGEKDALPVNGTNFLEELLKVALAKLEKQAERADKAAP